MYIIIDHYYHTHTSHIYMCIYVFLYLQVWFISHIQMSWGDVLNGEQSLSFSGDDTLFYSNWPTSHTHNTRTRTLTCNCTRTHTCHGAHSNANPCSHTHTQNYGAYSYVNSHSHNIETDTTSHRHVIPTHTCTHTYIRMYTIHAFLHTRKCAMEWCLEWWTIPEFSGDENLFNSNWPTSDTHKAHTTHGLANPPENVHAHTHTLEHTHMQIQTHIYRLWSDVLNGEQSLSFPVMRILFIQTDHRVTRPTTHMNMHIHTNSHTHTLWSDVLNGEQSLSFPVMRTFFIQTDHLATRTTYSNTNIYTHIHTSAREYTVEWCLEWWTIPEFSGDENPFYSNWPQTRDT